jgi:hypothetical protein
MTRTIRALALALAAVGLLAGTATAQERSKHVLHDVVTGKIKPAQITVRPAPDAALITKTMPFFSSGTLKAAEIALRSGPDHADEALADGSGPNLAAAGGAQAPNTVGCGNRTSNGNVRVNQDCSYRRQAEEKIVYSPANPNNLLAGQNDSRVGFNQCGIDWSTDDGVHWGDLLPPFRQRLNNPESLAPTSADPNSHTIVGGPGTFHTYDADSDPAPAFDAHGRGFFTCIAFDVASNANLIYATQSPAAAQGSFFYNLDTAGRNFIVDEENDPRASLDKPFITADTFTQSPNVDNVYATWTVFIVNCAPNGQGVCSSPISGRCPPTMASPGRRPRRSAAARRHCAFSAISLTPRAARTLVTSIRVQIRRRSRTATWSSSSPTATPRRTTPTASSWASSAILPAARLPAPRG